MRVRPELKGQKVNTGSFNDDAAPAASWPMGSEVDCSAFVLRFSKAHGRSRLEIAFCGGLCNAPALQSLEGALSAAVAHQAVLVYDLRLSGDVHQDILVDLKVFWHADPTRSKRVRCAVFLVHGNIVEKACDRQFGALLQACCLICPFVATQSPKTAEDFIQRCLMPEGASPSASLTKAAAFLTLVNVQDCSSSPKPLREGESTASLTTFQAPQKGAADMGAVLHTLPNGDVRVIQSPMQEAMNHLPSEAVFARTASTVSSFCSMAGDLRDALTVRLPCTIEVLEQLKGCSFEAKELAHDTARELRARAGERKLSTWSVAGTFTCSRCCAGGLMAFLGFSAPKLQK